MKSPELVATALSKDPLIAKLKDEAAHGELELATRQISCDTSGASPRAAVQYQTVKPDDSLTLNVVLLRSVAQNGWLIDSWKLEGETEHVHQH